VGDGAGSVPLSARSSCRPASAGRDLGNNLLTFPYCCLIFLNVGVASPAMSTSNSRNHAVVLGAGMAGLLAARVLSEFYQAVTIVDRDELSEDPLQRKGIPQGRHVHAFMSSGSHVVNRLFPGLLDDLVAAGANVWDDGDLSRVCFRSGRYEFKNTGRFTDPEASATYLASRPFLETHVRRRVRAIANVLVLDGHDVVEAVADTPDRVIGVRVIHRETGHATVVNAQLVVDAMGRGAFTPAFLDNLGYGRPAEQRSKTRVVYASQLMRIPPGMVTEKLTLVVPSEKQPTGGGILACENDTMIVTVSRLGGHQPPIDLAGILSAAAQFAPASVLAALREGTPLGEVSIYHYPGSIWRRYDKMHLFPAGLLVFGDAIASFNPSYGQGMTLAALQAEALRDCLAHGDADLARRFFASTAKTLGLVWQMNRMTGEFVTSQQRHHRPGNTRLKQVQQRLVAWWMDQIMTAVGHDIVVAETLFRVNNLTAPPTRLQDPRFHARVLVASLRRHTYLSTASLAAQHQVRKPRQHQE
jgi:2-polyprenyl-6-methoxyphenol hydroxylase-like FAD-dependent oxidoreductase